MNKRYEDIWAFLGTQDDDRSASIQITKGGRWILKEIRPNILLRQDIRGELEYRVEMHENTYGNALILELVHLSDRKIACTWTLAYSELDVCIKTAKKEGREVGGWQLLPHMEY